MILSDQKYGSFIEFDERADSMSAATWQTIFLVVIGAILIISGLSNLSDFFKLRKKGTVIEGDVHESHLVERTDGKGNLIQHYYDLTVWYKDGRRIIPSEIKSIVKYEKGDKVPLLKDGQKVSVYTHPTRSGYIGLCLAIAGAAVVFSPFLTSRFGENAGNLMTVVIFVFVGLASFLGYRSESVAGLSEIKGHIAKMLMYQTDQDRRYLASPKTWYPIIEYEDGGRVHEFRSSFSSAYKSSFKEGAEVTIYKNPADGQIVEKKPSRLFIVLSAICWAIALISLVSFFIAL